MADWYPDADRTTQRFDDDYPGTFTGGPRKGVLHSTETLSWPGYSGGASAPHFTVHGTRVRQHFPVSMPSRALRNLDGGVQTNRDGVIQIEVVCYSDEKVAADVGGVKAVALPTATLDTVRTLMRWVEANAGVKRKAVPADRWLRYPASYGANGVRMSGAAWDGWDGWCGHMHVPENSHGDPSAINIGYLMSGDDMDLSDKVSIADWIKNKWDDAGLQDGFISVNTALGSGYGHARRAGDYSHAAMRDTAAIRKELAAAKLRQEALLAAVQGLDTAAVLARIDQHAAEETARAQAEADRDAQILALLEQHATGALDAEAVVRRIGELLSAATPEQ